MHSALEEENTFTRMRVSLGIYKQVTLADTQVAAECSDGVWLSVMSMAMSVCVYFFMYMCLCACISYKLIFLA